MRFPFASLRHSICHCFLCVDIDCYAGRLHLTTSRSIVLSAAGGAMLHIQTILVSAWIAIGNITGKGRLPLWVKWYGRFSYVTVYISEIALGFLETRVGDAARGDVTINGTVRGVKYIYYSIILGSWCLLSFKHGSLIKRMLQSSKNSDAQLLKVSRYLNIIGLLSVFGILIKLGPLPIIMGKTLERYLPPCKMKWFTAINAIYLSIQYATCYIQAPGDKKMAKKISSGFNSTFRSKVGPSSTTSASSGAGSSGAGNSGAGSSGADSSRADSSRASFSAGSTANSMASSASVAE